MFVSEYNPGRPPRPEPLRPEPVRDERIPVSWALVGFVIALAPVGIAFCGAIVWIIIG